MPMIRQRLASGVYKLVDAPVVRDSRITLPCIHLGDVLRRADGLRQTVECPPCSQTAGMTVNAQVHACTVHGRCTVTKNTGEVHCCIGCPDRSTPDAFQLVVNAAGIGDHLAAASIGAAWKERNPGKHLHIVGMSRQWIDLFDCCDSLSTARMKDWNDWRNHLVPGATPIYTTVNDRSGLHFIEAVARLPLTERKRPALRPLPDDATTWAEQFRGCAVLAPISLGSGAGRNWLMSHWLLLERFLNERGVQCVAIGAGTDAPRLTHFRGQQICGKPATHVAALMRVASVVVSNESGMAHLAGALDVPCITLAAQLIGKPIYAAWPSVQVIQGPLPCGGCRWTGPNWRGHCDSVCANLQAITPEQVLAACEVHTGTPERPYLADEVLDRELQGHLSKLVVPNPAPSLAPLTLADRRQTFRLFLREILSKPTPLVLETGCQRADLDYGAGMSSTIIGLALRGHGGRLVSLDYESQYVTFCTARTTNCGLPVEVIHTDSRAWLKSYSGPKIDALYLDSADTWTPGFQDCNLEEAKLALPLLAPDAVVMIDDTWRLADGWGGKGAKSVPWLISQGFRVMLDGWQVVLKR